MHTGVMLWLCLCSILLVACVQPDNIKQYAEASARSLNNLQQVTKDYAAGCSRRHPTRTERCKQARLAADSINQVTKVLQEYMRLLSALSNGQTTNYSRSLTRLTRELKSLPTTPSPQQRRTLNAAHRVVDLLITLRGDQSRRTKLANAIRSVDPHLNRLTDRLASVVRENYRLAVDLEADQLRRRQRLLQKRHAASEPLAWQLYQEQVRQQLKLFRTRKAALLRLSKALDEMGKLHTRLAQKSTAMSGKQLLVEVKQYARKVDAVTKELKKLL